MQTKPAALKALEQALGYKFKSRPLAEQALTHASVRGGRSAPADNERLEFVGDRVLGLAISADLCGKHPDAREGELARRFNRLVRGRTCAMVARAVGVGPALIMSESEAAAGGRDKDTILADAMEALLGAIFLEAGFETARDVLLRLWEPHIHDDPKAVRDAKSELQEWAQGQGLDLPEYVEVERSGPDHAPRFVSRVATSSGLNALGEGKSKRQAEQAAATALLRSQGVWSTKTGE
ncbi:MAG: ribonuclease III [Hyphomicrobiaceae bacterium]|nr:ribonuclease III [Hyphomicrobiaceae bacterium]